MTTVLAFLFIFVAILVVASVVRSFSARRPMPSACPRCGERTRDGAGITIRWYRHVRFDRFRCRACTTAFREHPNGTLVEDRADYD